MEPITELTPKGQAMFKKLYAEGLLHTDRQAELQALASTPEDAPFVLLKVIGDGQLGRMMNKGWELVSNTNTTAVRIVSTYLMRKSRVAVDLDILPDEVVK